MRPTTVRTRGPVRAPAAAGALGRLRAEADGTADAEEREAAGEELRRRLEAGAARGIGTHRLLLRQGRAYQPGPLPKGVTRIKRWKCFEAAHRLASRTGRTYVEGYAVPVDGSPPEAHAWVVDAGSEVAIDPRWGSALAYFGMPVDEPTRRRITGEDRYDYPIIPEVGFLAYLADDDRQQP